MSSDKAETTGSRGGRGGSNAIGRMNALKEPNAKKPDSNKKVDGVNITQLCLKSEFARGLRDNLANWVVNGKPHEDPTTPMVGPFPDEILGTLIALPGMNEHALLNSSGVVPERYKEFADANPIYMRTVRQAAKNADVVVFDNDGYQQVDFEQIIVADDNLQRGKKHLEYLVPETKEQKQARKDLAAGKPTKFQPRKIRRRVDKQAGQSNDEAGNPFDNAAGEGGASSVSGMLW